MTIVVLDKENKDEDSKYHTIKDIDVLICSDEMIEIRYENGTRETRSTKSIKIISIDIEENKHDNDE